jgi:hypothetical protein
VQHLRTFGCVVHVKDTTSNLKKLDDRSRPMIIIGYEPGSKAYQVYDSVSNKVHMSRDIVLMSRQAGTRTMGESAMSNSATTRSPWKWSIPR